MIRGLKPTILVLRSRCLNPLPHTAILQQTSFRKIFAGAISSFVTMFSNVVCCSRHKNEYLWSKGLTVSLLLPFLINVNRMDKFEWSTKINFSLYMKENLELKFILKKNSAYKEVWYVRKSIYFICRQCCL